MPARLKTGDEVIVIGGKDRGKRGRILRVEPKKHRVVHRGPEHRQAPPAPAQVGGAQRAEQVGGVIEREGPIHISNVMLARPRRTSKPTRVGHRGPGRQALPDRPPQRD